MTRANDASLQQDHRFARPVSERIIERAISVFFAAAMIATVTIWMPLVGWGAWMMVDALI